MKNGATQKDYLLKKKSLKREKKWIEGDLTGIAREKESKTKKTIF